MRKSDASVGGFVKGECFEEGGERAEGYPGLVVHGPLIATLLLDLLRRERPAARVRRFGFTAVRPTFDTHAFRVAGRDAGPEGLELWAQDHEGWLTMRARAELA